MRAWFAIPALVLGLVMLPVVSVLILAVSPDENIWPHLASTVLPGATFGTLALMTGTGVLTLIIGTGAAWLVTMYRFPGRGLLDWLLVLPLAMPVYLVAYANTELFDYAGPVQTALRQWFGWQSPSDYWFPDLRSLPGAVLIFSSVLYPYVYLSARASFVQQSVCALEVARTLGCSALGAFWKVGLPLARPALAAGTALALMECLNDIGAVRYLGIETLTSSIFATWTQRSNLSGAAQLALVLMAFAVVLFTIERNARGNGGTAHTTGRFRSIPFEDLPGFRGYVASLLAFLPAFFGFVLPLLVLIQNAVQHPAAMFDNDMPRAAANSLMLSATAAIIIAVLALALVYARRLAGTKVSKLAINGASLGYAMPGTVLAIGLMIPLAAFDNALDGALENMFGLHPGLLLSGTVTILILAYVVRFLVVGLAPVDSGLSKIAGNLDQAARTLGLSAWATLKTVHLPLLKPAIGAAALLVFVDAMKELPATLLLRPFNFNTLATKVYDLASLEQFEEAAGGALLIVAAGLVPVLLLHRAVSRGRSGSGSGS